MILPDVNPLIYALCHDEPHHETARRWLLSVIDGDVRFGMSPQALNSVVRIATNRRVYREPSTPRDAFAFCDHLLSHPLCVQVDPREHHWSIFRRLCIDVDIRGPTVTDAWFAALAIEWGCEWVTYDRDFARFPGLRWSTPPA